MRLESVFIRFYKSFNVDYMRHTDSRAKKKPWEVIRINDDTELWYPYIQIPIDRKITAIVGANESGKSHLLSAIEKAITGYDSENNPISSSDFCRYSERFLVTSDINRLPDFGTEWHDVSEVECQQIKKLSDIPKSRNFNKFLLFRTKGNSLTIYLTEEGKYSEHQVHSVNVEEFREILPGTRRLKNKVALPSSIPIQRLVQKITGKDDGTRYELLSNDSRRELHKLLDAIHANSGFFTNLSKPNTFPDNSNNKPNHILLDIVKILSDPDANLKENERKRQEDEISLTYDLLFKIAKITLQSLVDLAKAMEKNDIGHTQALVDKINKQLSANLNFPNYWVQDSEFRLLMSAKDHNLEFSIIDRTGTKYSFEERSSGLKYFLSYFIQHRAYEPPNNVPEILLMDEPDAFLSNQAQQDLLKIFEEVANTEDDKSSSQVVYVTHSPFLIDKNHAERIRVLDKGKDYEGTIVIKSTYQNHYEPLRSAFGAFVAETVYIGHCNLMVEGIVDQVLLAGVSTYLRNFELASKRESLNLNEITIVPAGGTGNVPYLTYLARGRDSEQPSVIVLLDSDKNGNEAKIELTKKGYGPRKKPPLKEEFVLQVGDLANLGVWFPEKLLNPELEDLIPAPICVMAARNYAADVYGINERDLQDITETYIHEVIESGATIFNAVYECVKQCSKDQYRLDKIGFARSVIDVVNKLRNSHSEEIKYTQALEVFDSNFKILFRELDKMKSLAELERTKKKAAQKVKELANAFFTNHPKAANREDAVEFLEKLEALLVQDDSFDSDEIRKGISSICKDYKLHTNLSERVENYEYFKQEVQSLQFSGKRATQKLEENNDVSSENPSINGSSENPDLNSSPSLNTDSEQNTDSDNGSSDSSSPPNTTKMKRSKTNKIENQNETKISE
jgi:predicted ATPase